MTTQANWYEAYKTAVLETDWTKIERKIQAAEDGIGARLHEFSFDHGGTPEENRVIVAKPSLYTDTQRQIPMCRNPISSDSGVGRDAATCCHGINNSIRTIRV